MKLESKIGTIRKSAEEVYTFLTNFKNFEKFIPQEKLKNWQAEEEKCKFTIDMAGDIEMRLIDREPFKTIKVSGETSTQPISFFFWIQLKEINQNETKVKLTLKAELPAMVQMMAKKPLKEALDSLSDKLGNMFDNNFF